MKFRPDRNSIRFRIYLAFLVFAIVVALFMWFFQVFFIDNYYENPKIEATEAAASNVAAEYESNGLDACERVANSETENSEMYICIISDGITVYPENTVSIYADVTDECNGNVWSDYSRSNPSALNSYTNIDDATGRDVACTGVVLDETENTSLLVFIPLTPDEAMSDFMNTQTIFVMAMIVILLIVLAFYLSQMFSRPIGPITESVKKLSDGQYGTFVPASINYTELAALSGAIDKLSTELEHAAMMQKETLANVMHDLRTPLTMIRSYAEMLRDLSGDDPEKRTEHLNVIIDETDRLNELVNDMLLLSRMQTGRVPLEWSVFDICDVMDSILAPYRVLEEKEEYNLIFNCKKGTYVKGDEGKIKNVISNLLSNGVKYCGEDKEVIINVRHWGKKVHIEVVDHGIGIKPEELPHIWDRHYKTSSNHVRPTRGSGLGLSIVSEILKLHGAKYGAESKVGKGTTVWFELESAQPDDQ